MNGLKLGKNNGAILLGAILTFFIAALILQVTYNFAVPRLAKSVNKEFRLATDFTPITFGTAAVVTILVGILFGCHGATLAILLK